MNTPERFEDRLRACLERLELKDKVVSVFPADHGRYRYFGHVVSSDFEGQYQGLRQSLVWGQILDDLSDTEQERVEFVYTDTPTEQADLTRATQITTQNGDHR